MANETEKPEKDTNARPALAIGRARTYILLSYLLYAVMTVAILFSLHSLGQGLVVASLNRLLEPQGVTIHLGQAIDVQPLAASLTLRDLRISQGSQVFFKARSLTLVLQPLQWSFDALILRDLRFEEPLLFLDSELFSKLGENATNEPPQKRKALGESLQIEHFAITKGTLLALLGPDKSVSVNGLTLLSDSVREPKKTGYALTLALNSARLKSGAFALPLEDIEGHGRLFGGKLWLDSLNVHSQNTALATSGEIDFGNGRGLATVALDLPLSELKARWPKLPVFTGTARLTVELGGDWLKRSGALDGTLFLRGVRVDWLNAEDADLRFHATPDEVILNGSVLHFAQGAITMNAVRIGLHAPYPIHAAVTLREVELGHILDNVAKNVHSRVMQWNSGPVEMSGTLWPFKMEGNAELTVRKHSVNTAWFHERQTGREILAVPLAKIKVGLYADTKCFEIRPGKVYVGASVVDVQIVHFGFDGYMNMAYASEQVDLADVGVLLGMNIRGKGRLFCELHGPYSHQQLNAWVDLREAGINRFELGTLRSNVKWEARDLGFTEIRGLMDGSEYRGEVRFDFGRLPTGISAQLETGAMPLAAMLEGLGLKSGLGEQLSGTVAAKARLFGQFGDLSGELDAHFPRFTSRAQHFDSAQLSLSLCHNLLELKRAEARLGSARLWATGTLSNWRDLTGRIESEGFDISDLDFTAFALKEAKGALALRGVVSGSLAVPVLEAEARLEKLSTPQGPLEASELHAVLTPEYLNLRTRLFGQALRFNASFHFAQEERVEMEAQFTDFPYAALPRHLWGWPIDDGRISGSLSVVGPYSQLAKAQGHAEIEALSLVLGKRSFAIESPARLTFGGGVLTLAQTNARGEGVSFSAQGTLNTQGQLNVLANGRGDLGLLSGIFSAIENASGAFDFDLTLGGNLQKPAVFAKLTLAGASLRAAGAEGSFENITGPLIYDVDRLQTTGLRFLYAGGEVTLGGQAGLELGTGRLHDVDLRADVTRLSLPLDEGLTPVLSGRLTLSGDPWPLTLGGTLVVDELRYLRSVRWQKKVLVDSVINALKPRHKRTTKEELPRLSFNVAISAPETIEVRNNLAALTAQAELTLTGSEQNPGLLGAISADRGVFYFERNPFDVTRLAIEFANPGAISPRLDIAGETTLRYIEYETEKDIRIRLELKGELNNLEVTLSSDSGLPQTDLVSLLVFGQTADKLQSQGGMVTGINALGDLYGVNEQIRDQFKLDIFRFSTEVENTTSGASAAIVPRLEIGKEITRNLTLTFKTTLATTQDNRADQRFEVKYHVKDFTLSGQWDNHSFAPQGNFGADLTYNFDF